MNPRWAEWVRVARLTDEEARASTWRFTQWISRHLTEWAKSEGYVADLRCDPRGSGVVIRTQTEANRAALSAEGGHVRFTTYLQSLEPT